MRLSDCLKSQLPYIIFNKPDFLPPTLLLHIIIRYGNFDNFTGFSFKCFPKIVEIRNILCISAEPICFTVANNFEFNTFSLFDFFQRLALWLNLKAYITIRTLSSYNACSMNNENRFAIYLFIST